MASARLRWLNPFRAPSDTTVGGVLAVIDKGCASTAHPTPLLFVHGGYHAAWCWDEHFLDFFAAAGYRVLAPSLRGHGDSPLAGRLNDCSIADYVRDVASVAGALPIRPVVIGHSMGGFIVQKYLEAHPAPAAVLLASAPPGGMAATALRTALAHPWKTLRATVGRDMLAVVGSPRLSRQAFFTPSTPESLVAQYSSRLQQESHRALSVDMMFGDLPQPRRISTTMLVLGGQADWMLRPKQVRANASAYATTAEFFPVGHDMMLEPSWRSVAERIDGWLVERELGVVSDAVRRPRVRPRPLPRRPALRSPRPR
jgi:pimeloyl-ACP methyl ester carboxylesterase